MAKTKKQIQRETRRKKTTLKGRKKANMRGGQDKYTVPKNLELNNSMSDFTDITSNNIFLNMSKKIYPEFYKNVEEFIAKKNYADKTTYLSTLHKYLNNGKENPDDIKSVVYGLRDLIIPDHMTQELKSSLLKYTKDLYNNIIYEFTKPGNIVNPCHDIFIAKVGTETPNILNKKQLEKFEKMKAKKLHEFFSYLLDYLKFDPDDKCMPLGRGKIRCACYNKTEMTENPAYETVNPNLSNYQHINPKNIPVGHTHHHRLNRNPVPNKYAKLSTGYNRKNTVVNNPLYKGANPYYSEPVNTGRNNHDYESIPKIMGDPNNIMGYQNNNNYTNRKFIDKRLADKRLADWRLAEQTVESPYFTTLEQQENATFKNAEKKSVAITPKRLYKPSNNSTKTNRLYESSNKFTKKKGFFGRAANAVRQGLARTLGRR
jgi:hypothetical protein